MPEVAIYDSPEPNAFATGRSRNNSLVAVSTGLLRAMNANQASAVLGHEVSHIANGDMVTLTLIQGVLNTFVIFLSRVIGYIVDRALHRDDEGGGYGIGYFVTVIRHADPSRHPGQHGGLLVLRAGASTGRTPAARIWRARPT